MQHPLLWPDDNTANNFTLIQLKASIPKKIKVPEEYRTIQKAVEAAMPKDVIEVSPGTYTENVVINKQLTIRAPYGNSILNAANTSFSCILVTVDNITISGLTCQKGSHVIELWRSCNNIIENNTVKNNDNNGIILKKSNNNRIINNDASNNDKYNGIALDSSNNNEIRNNSANYNRHCGIGPWTSDENIIANNIVSKNRAGIYLESSDNNRIYLNNIIRNTVNVKSFSSTNTLNSSSEITYTYNGSTYTNYPGNNWDDYKGSDVDGDGIGDTPHRLTSDNDNYPLILHARNYFGEQRYL